MRNLLGPLLLALCSLAWAADYAERLDLRPLPQSALLASFNFRSNSSLADFESQNFRYLPRSLGQILQHAGTRELHLRFGLGRWDAQNWGARPWEGQREGGTGVELWAWLEAATDDEADQKWLTLTNALSGLFCASLNFVDSTRTTRPAMSFQAEGNHANKTIPNLRLLHGVLPKEVVCTENLTPFLKLLPCKGKSGISTLLDGHKLFDSSYQSMAIDVKPICSPDGQCVLQLEQTIDMVLDIDRSKRPRGNPIPRPPPRDDVACDTSKPYDSPDTCFPVGHTLGHEWSLSQIFGRSIRGSCPLADVDAASVCIQVPEARVVQVSDTMKEQKSIDRASRCFTIAEEGDADITLPKHSPEDVSELVSPPTPLIYADRSLMGHGQERGGVQAILTNPSPDTEVEFIYMESLPWFMRVYLHTLNARIEGSQDSASDIIRDIYYRPAVDRTRGTQLELRVRIPPASTVFLTYDFEQTILRYTEYPPDANRGFDVAAAVITTLHPRVQSVRTTTMLLNLPVPDFSMPYNVIIFTSTAIALAFGGMYNILVRRLVGADEAPGPLAKAKLAKLLSKLRLRRSTA
ncbi:GPI transamidase component GPI16 [Plectosphaerella plurivora]|uniref:GPI transamidase component GPI16 n=1 Tax=Plectosphaerella plurivora TaxID=936078 RepID=A0A9P8V764_9PEZI|nr:GPI transamidase component GPI16 [Plectosphaerella plurivora]